MECLEALGCIAPDAVVVANIGIHFNEPAALQKQVSSFIRWHAGARGNGTLIGRRPCVLWRQTLPQHFPTHDGTYQRGWLFDEACGLQGFPTSQSGCVPVPPALNSSQQRFNDVTDGMVSAAQIPAIASWNLAASLWKEHPGCIVKPLAWTSANLTFRRTTASTVRVMDCSHYKQCSPLNGSSVCATGAKVVHAIAMAIIQHCTTS